MSNILEPGDQVTLTTSLRVKDPAGKWSVLPKGTVLMFARIHSWRDQQFLWMKVIPDGRWYSVKVMKQMPFEPIAREVES